MAPIRVLVADDEPEIRTLVAELLEETGYAVEVVGDGFSALNAICADPPALALLDVAMPVMTGDDALHQLRAAGRTVPVIMMTAGTNPQRFLQVGATAVLPKPFSLEQLMRVIDQALGPASPGDGDALGRGQPGRLCAPR